MSTLKYEPGVIVAEGDFVIIHGRFSGNGRPRSWIAADVVCIADDVLAEHWDVLQDEATRAESKSGLPMLTDCFVLIPHVLSPQAAALPQFQPAQLSTHRKVLALGVMCLGFFIAYLDIQIVAASLQEIGGGLSA